MQTEHLYKTALVTGGSSGIGLAISKQLLRMGFKLLISGLEESEVLEAEKQLKAEIKNADLHVCFGDLSQRESADRLWSFAKKVLGHIDVLINNAGFGHYAFTPDTDLKKEQRMIALNCIAVHQLSILASKEMCHRNLGHIINISSISAFQPAPMLNTYASTKAFVFQFTMGLHYEFKMRGLKVNATAICPTPVRTGFEATAGLGKTGLYSSWMLVDTDTVAKAVVKVLGKQVSHRVPGFWFHFLNKISRRLPYSWTTVLAQSALKEKVKK
jgi:short-subunit dehydrogenase